MPFTYRRGGWASCPPFGRTPKPTLRDIMPNQDEPFDSLPPAIIDALRELDGPSVLPDAQRDADVLSGARQHLAGVAQVQRKRRNLRLFFAGGAGSAVAAAAMITIVMFVGNPANEPQADAPSIATQHRPGRPTAGGDLDANGSVDILDAYRLAKHLERNDAAEAYDVNADGLIDQLDIDWIANQAVALNTGERG